MRSGFLRIAAINLLMFVAVILIAEFGARAAKFAQTCLSDCDAQYLKNPVWLIPEPKFSDYDPVLGFVPKPGVDMDVDSTRFSRWAPGSRLSIDENGFRRNDNDGLVPRDGPTLIAAGDSFVFGHQVGNRDTWPACVERETALRTVNAGMPGYGTAQALLRLETVLERFDFDAPVLVLETTVGDDFGRDRQSGYPEGGLRPAVVKTENGTLQHAPVPPFDLTVSAGDPAWYDPLLEAVLTNSWVIKRLQPGLVRRYLDSKKQGLRNIPENAADIEEIIEWTFGRFAAMDGPKLVVLQYWNNVGNPAVAAERAFIRDVLADLGLDFVDTHDPLFDSGGSPDALYDWHLTAEGNELVCALIAGKIDAMLADRP